MWEVVARRCSAKTLSWKFHNIYREIPVLDSLSNEAVVQRCSVKGVFLKISQNSQENICAGVSFLIKLQASNFIEKETLAQVFPVNFSKFLGASSSTEHLQWLLLFLMLWNAFRQSGLQLCQRETPVLVFQNQPFVDPLQNRCFLIIHKIHGKTLVLESLFK